MAFTPSVKRTAQYFRDLMTQANQLSHWRISPLFSRCRQKDDHRVIVQRVRAFVSKRPFEQVFQSYYVQRVHSALSSRSDFDGIEWALSTIESFSSVILTVAIFQVPVIGVDGRFNVSAFRTLASYRISMPRPTFSCCMTSLPTRRSKGMFSFLAALEQLFTSTT